MELAEVYRIMYEEGPDDTLRGTIRCEDEENGYQDLFSVDGDVMLPYYEQSNLRRKPLIKSLDHIIPNGPTKASISAKNGFSISFDLFGVIIEEVTIEYPRRPDMLSAPLREDLLSQDGTRYLSVFYAIFEDAAEAHVNVTFTGKSDPFYLYGVVAARTSAIDKRAYSSIIFLKGHGEKIKVDKGDDIVIPFSRHIVAVPLNSKLILEFSLSVSDNDKTLEDGSDQMVEEIVTFDAKRDGPEPDSSLITCSKGVFKVDVKWTSTRKSEEPEDE